MGLPELGLQVALLGPWDISHIATSGLCHKQQLCTMQGTCCPLTPSLAAKQWQCLAVRSGSQAPLSSFDGLTLNKLQPLQALICPLHLVI